jgi:hypothetical protein
MQTILATELRNDATLRSALLSDVTHPTNTIDTQNGIVVKHELWPLNNQHQPYTAVAFSAEVP